VNLPLRFSGVILPLSLRAIASPPPQPFEPASGLDIGQHRILDCPIVFLAAIFTFEKTPPNGVCVVDMPSAILERDGVGAGLEVARVKPKCVAHVASPLLHRKLPTPNTTNNTNAHPSARQSRVTLHQTGNVKASPREGFCYRVTHGPEHDPCGALTTPWPGNWAAGSSRLAERLEKEKEADEASALASYVGNRT
jgi:hypothetical protein